ncbi:hypothetical protein FHS34_008256 [Streptomyces echinatus]|uniref:Uncharacterized protein n=1 Tax=Streptomyces echinatus TaxID=67293 RepID=A0A7W9Q3K7_9ACTN|nr:hypothetical protein [Streptomyces echinatus]
MKVLRGEGSREHARRTFFGVRRYLEVVHPILKG